MAALRSAFEDAGCRSVVTHLQSGNALCTHPLADRRALAQTLEDAIEGAFGVSTPVILRTAAEVGEVSRARPFGPDTSHAHVAFLAGEPQPEAVRELAALDLAPDRFEVVGSDVFLHYPNGVSGARLTTAVLERRLGVASTIRNWRTVARLAELAAQPL
jgi:uncharacterized protein (DUF1697 family)